MSYPDPNPTQFTELSGDFRLTTEDNPFNPFTEHDKWLMEDIRLGHNTYALLARVCGDTDINDGSIDDAMREIVFYNYSGKHLLVTKDLFESLMAVDQP